MLHDLGRYVQISATVVSVFGMMIVLYLIHVWKKHIREVRALIEQADRNADGGYQILCHEMILDLFANTVPAHSPAYVRMKLLRAVSTILSTAAVRQKIPPEVLKQADTAVSEAVERIFLELHENELETRGRDFDRGFHGPFQGDT